MKLKKFSMDWKLLRGVVFMVYFVAMIAGVLMIIWADTALGFKIAATGGVGMLTLIIVGHVADETKKQEGEAE